MNRLLPLLLALALPATAAAIVGGQPVETQSGVRRHTVLVIGSGSRCTGVVVDKDIILTAAHCFGESKRTRILFRDPLNRVAEVATDTVVSHPAYNPAGRSVRERGVDLAMLRLPRPLPEFMAAIGIGEMEDEGVVRIAGYGVEVEGMAPTANALRQALLVGKPAPAGNSMVIIAVGAGVGGAMTGVGACVGDSGGPMVSERTQLLVGVIGSGIPIAGARSQCGGYTAAIRLSDHLAWINATADAMRRLEMPLPASVAAQPK